MSTLLALIQAACAEIGIPSPSFVVNNADLQVGQLLALANREGREQVAAEGGWSQLRAEQDITLVNGQAAYAFPTDFQSYIPSTIWDRDMRWPVAGPLNAQEWQYIKSGLITGAPWQRFRVMMGQIYFDPTPSTTTAGQTVAIEYQSKNFCQSASGTKQPAWVADTDTFLLPDDVMVLGVKWRYLAAKRLDYSEEKKAWADCCDRELARSYVGRTVPLGAGGHRNFLGDGYSQVQDGDWPGRV